MPTNGTPRRKPSRAPDLALTVQYGIRSAQLPSRAKLRLWARAALRQAASITLRIVGAREARRLNRRFRGCDYATNVLTFAYSSHRPFAGDIAICAPVAALEARALGITREAHYAHLTVHGVLHLQGHDHQHAREARRMERLEAHILARFGYSDPYGGKERHERKEERGERREARKRNPATLTSPSSRTHGG